MSGPLVENGDGSPAGAEQRATDRGPTGLPEKTPLTVWLAWFYIAPLAAPALGGLPGGAPLAILVMMVGIPFWFEVARVRRSPYDAAATRTISIVFACTGFLIFWSFLSIFGAEEPFRSSRYFATLVSAFAIYLMVRSTVTRRRIVQYMGIESAGLAATAMLSLLAFKIGPLHEMIFKGTDRAAGLFKNPNQFGMAISTAIPVTMALVLASRERRVFRIGCLLLMLLGLVASGSKTNLLLASVSLLAMLLLHAVISYSGAKRAGMMMLYVLGSFAFVLLDVAALYFLNPRALTIMSKFFSDEGQVESLTTRSFLWTYSLNQFLADPILGQGAGQKIDIFYRVEDVPHSHNVLLDYMRTLGAPGLAGMSVLICAVIVLCLATIARALQAKGAARSDRVLCFGLSMSPIVYVAANMSSDSFGPSTSPYFWIFSYLAFAARRLLDPMATSTKPSDRQLRLPSQMTS